MHRKNLLKLAKFLWTNAEQVQEHFAMDSFCTNYEDFELRTRAHVLSIRTGCNTVACAVGWGPTAGVPALPDESWQRYSWRAFRLPNWLWQWCFSGDWAVIDNTPRGAAQRILYMLRAGNNPQYDQFYTSPDGFRDRDTARYRDLVPTEDDWKELDDAEQAAGHQPKAPGEPSDLGPVLGDRGSVAGEQQSE